MTSPDALSADIEQLWAAMLHLVVDRVQLIRDALDASGTSSLHEATRAAAASAAHKLAGALGSYRRPAGSAAAAAAERALAAEPVDIDALTAAVADLDRVLAGQLR